MFNSFFTGGEAVSRVELNEGNTALSFDNLAQIYVFVNGVAGVLAKWFRPAAKKTTYNSAWYNNYKTIKRDEHGNFCK